MAAALDPAEVDVDDLAGQLVSMACYITLFLVIDEATK